MVFETMSTPFPDLSTTPWLDAARAPAWRDEARAWVAGTAGAPVQAFEVVKARPWSFVARAELAAGRAWFKACGPMAQHEGALLEFLATRTDCAPKLLAQEPRRRWLLVADHGASLRDGGSADDRLAAWLDLLPRYARLQIACLGNVESLLGLGLPDRRVACLPALLADLLAQLPELVLAGDDADQARALQARATALLDALERHALRLACSPFAASIDHGDLHANNVMTHGDATRLVDWGDACVTHPFGTLAVTLPAVLAEWDAGERLRVARALCEAYLAPWQALSTPQALQRDLHTALWIGRAVRILDFARMFESADAASRERWLPLLPRAIASWVDCHALVAAHDESLLVAPA